MNEPPELLIIDLDGTLLGSQGRVSAANQEAIQDARASGIQVMIATGRIHAECRSILESIEYEGPLVIASGAALVDWPDGRMLSAEYLPAQQVGIVMEVMMAHGGAPLALMDASCSGYDYLVLNQARIHPVSHWWFDSHGIEPEYADSFDGHQHRDSVLRVACLGEPEVMASAAQDLKDRIGDSLNWRHWPAVGPEDEVIHMLEVFGPGVDKWAMIECYCRENGIAPERVAAIGDGLNDIEMLTGAGFGIAVANADESVLAIADARTASHLDDGVAHAVARLLKGWA
ncbi:MAG: hypothetical protein CMJ39_06055 [Phycisphaerae bacterium]|nr:hypothetical protein [Phycisphaerae bacterium]|tara:strand:- start:1218 stop:2078 length:861 start_codon:yes stop_codon:yes gene_type:complete